MNEIRCCFCDKVIPRYTIDMAGYDRRNVSLYVCCECYDKVARLIQEGECDGLCEMRMAEIDGEGREEM